MAEFIDLGKIPESPEERQQLLDRREFLDGLVEQQTLNHIQANIVHYLLHEKGYLPEDIQVNATYNVTLSDGQAFQTCVDVLIVIDDRPIFMIKCAMNSLVSWDRYAIAFCRAGAGVQIPLAAITDGTELRLISGMDGSVSEGTLLDMPCRSEICQILALTEVSFFSKEKAERERRILFAFDALRCPTLADGYPKKSAVD